MNIGSINTVGFDKLSAAYQSNKATGGSALKGAMNIQKMLANDLSAMMRDATPHLGQNVDTEA